METASATDYPAAPITDRARTNRQFQVLIVLDIHASFKAFHRKTNLFLIHHPLSQ